MKRNGARWLLAWLCLLGGCSHRERNVSQAEQPIGAGSGGAPSESGAGGTQAGEDDDGASGGGTGGGGAGGVAPIDGGGGAAASTPIAGDDAGDAATAHVTDPRIPPANGDCPDLITGQQTILGLDVDIVAGPPAATPGPLLFVWHGNVDTGANALARLPRSVRDDIEASGGVIVAPNDTMTTRAGRDIAVSLDLWFDSDFDVADHIVACAVQSGRVDARRIYVTGCFAGGMMAGTMTVARSSYVAGAWFESGGIAVTDWPMDEPLHAPMVMALQGYHDELVIDTEPLAEQLGAQLVAAGGAFIMCRHDGPKCSGPVELQEQAWTLLKAYPFGTAPDLSAGLPSGYPDYCKPLH